MLFTPKTFSHYLLRVFDCCCFFGFFLHFKTSLQLLLTYTATYSFFFLNYDAFHQHGGELMTEFSFLGVYVNISGPIPPYNTQPNVFILVKPRKNLEVTLCYDVPSKYRMSRQNCTFKKAGSAHRAIAKMQKLSSAEGQSPQINLLGTSVKIKLHLEDVIFYFYLLLNISSELFSPCKVVTISSGLSDTQPLHCTILPWL